ncbi:hypothetical protein K502DRAFT_367113 [Neoconidiobolus thromboides FSU 785]|nr:hypothetical protein K502DRAFT_367113 [Neoconidiobolus thromboides FSU 785]
MNLDLELKKKELRNIKQKLEKYDVLKIKEDEEVVDLTKELRGIKQLFYSGLPQLFIDIYAKNELYKNLLNNSFLNVKDIKNKDVKLLILEDKIDKKKEELKKVIELYEEQCKLYYKKYRKTSKIVNKCRKFLSNMIYMKKEVEKIERIEKQCQMEIHEMSMELAKHEGIDYEEAKQRVIDDLNQQEEGTLRKEVEMKRNKVIQLKKEINVRLYENKEENIAKMKALINHYDYAKDCISKINEVTYVKLIDDSTLKVKYNMEDVYPTLFIHLIWDDNEYIVDELEVFKGDPVDEDDLESYVVGSGVNEHLKKMVASLDSRTEVDIKVLIFNVLCFLRNYHDME